MLTTKRQKSQCLQSDVLEDVPLFISKREIFIIFAIALLLYCIFVYLEYQNYKRIRVSPKYISEATLLNLYKKVLKNGKRYDILKLKDIKGYSYYAINWRVIDIKRGDRLKVEIITNEIDFLDYLRGFFAPIKSIEILSKPPENRLYNFIASNHKSLVSKEIFLSLFFAPLSQS